uniref:Hexosyltransferase n=1 Tax=Jaculus jaculus TaxID=51337 RepID=A0A8C5KQA1_JACJA
MRWWKPPLGLVLGACAAALVMLSLLLLPSPPPPPPCTWSQEPPVLRPAMVPARLAPVPCPANLSVSEHPGFAALPAHVRDFLLYKHCRRFPLLQAPSGDKCAGPVFLLLAIKSSPRNHERREAVRQTWGRERHVRGAQLRRLFLVGTELDPHQARKVNRLLEMEAQKHGDILQWDFHDSFFNLTLKQVLFLEWQETWCTNASFVLNGDDDVFAHTDNMVTYLQGHNPDRHLFVGQLIQNVGPVRVPWSKYFVPELVTPARHYPPYCGGGGVLLSRFTGAALRRAAPGLDLFPIDDVFLGMCLQREGLAPASHTGVRTAGLHSPSTRRSAFDPCFYRELLLVHRFLPFELLLMWDALRQPGLTC